MTRVACTQQFRCTSSRSALLQPRDATKRRCRVAGWHNQRLWIHQRQSWEGLHAAVADAEASVQVTRPVKFSIQQRVEFGEVLKVVGGSEQFGSWNPDAAPTLEWGEGHVWTWEEKLPVGEYEFKVVVARTEGSPSWEDGENRKLMVVRGETALDVNMVWGAVYDTAVGEVPVEDASAPEPTPEASSSNGVSAIGNGTSSSSIDGAVEAPSSSYFPDTIPSDLVQAALQQELEQSINGMGASGSGSQDYIPAGGADAFLRAASVRDLPNESSSSTDSSDSSTPALLATALASAAAVKQPQGTQAARKQARDTGMYGWEGAGPSGGAADALLSVAAFAAVPVVGWSLYTLHATGCGLPPGPNGLEGAVEGLSYLGVVSMAGYGLFKRASGSPSPGYAVAAEVLSYTAIAVGLAVLVAQVQTYGYIPSALPDSNCFGDGSLAGPPAPTFSLPALDLAPLRDSWKQAGSSLQTFRAHIPIAAQQLYRQLPAIDTAALTSQITNKATAQLQALTATLPSQDQVSAQLNQAVAQAQTLGAQLGSQAQTLGAQVGSQLGSSLSKAQELGGQLGAQAGSTGSRLLSQVDSSFQAVPEQLQQWSSNLSSAADMGSRFSSLGDRFSIFTSR